ncbi:basic salivary proline-rich protein 1-like [Equus caballus]|uniref:basic salivary proline-rich protein 1-like n=1 Tax=Equus caballus TaxID=9796 RepID=UPI0038B261BC
MGAPPPQRHRWLTARVGKSRRPPRCSALGARPTATQAADRQSGPGDPPPTQPADRQIGLKWQPAALLSPGEQCPTKPADCQSGLKWQPATLLSPGGQHPTKPADRQSGLKWQPAVLLSPGGPLHPHSARPPREWVNVAARCAAQPWVPHHHSAGPPPERVKVAAHLAAQPWGHPHPDSGGRPSEWVKVAARRAAQPWGPHAPLRWTTARVGKSCSLPHCYALGAPHPAGRLPEWVKVAAHRAAQPWGPPPPPLRRPTTRVGESGSPPCCSALSPPPHAGGRPQDGRPPEWVKVAARRSAQPWWQTPDSAGRLPEWVKVAARRTAKPWWPPPPPLSCPSARVCESGSQLHRSALGQPPHTRTGGRPPEWVKVAARPAAQPWGPHPPIRWTTARVGKTGSPPRCSALVAPTPTQAADRQSG